MILIHRCIFSVGNVIGFVLVLTCEDIRTIRFFSETLVVCLVGTKIRVVIVKFRQIEN